MKLCPNCSRTLEDSAQFCNSCGKTLAGVQSAPAPGHPLQPPGGHVPTSGKAVASLIFGIVGLTILPLISAIPAIILGHVSLSEIKKSAGRIAGQGVAIAGLVLGYLGIAFIPFILIIAAIAIPNLLRARIAANEASAVASLRTVNMACATYATTYNTFPPSLSSLGPSGEPSASAAGLIDTLLANGQKSGYVLTYEVGSPEDGLVKTYAVRADPLTPGTTGMRHFYTDQSGVVRFSRDGPANDSSDPLL